MAALQPTRRLNSRRSSSRRALATSALSRSFSKNNENASSSFQPLTHSLLRSFALQFSSTLLFSDACALFAQKQGGPRKQRRCKRQFLPQVLCHLHLRKFRLQLLY